MSNFKVMLNIIRKCNKCRGITICFCKLLDPLTNRGRGRRREYDDTPALATCQTAESCVLRNGKKREIVQD